MITVSTYKELEYYFDLFSKEKPSLVIIRSDGGLGKSTFAKEKTKNVIFINGHTTPLALYQKLCMHADEEIMLVLDDIDSLLQSYVMRALVKQICETKPIKTLGYLSTANIAQALPTSINVKLSTMILCNDLGLLNKNVSAIESRGHSIDFKPTKQEIIAKLMQIEGPEEVKQFIAAHAQFAKNLNLRTLVKGIDHHRMGGNWKEKILQEMGTEETLIEIDGLMQQYPTDRERIAHFSGSRATYYRWKSQSLANQPVQEVSPIPLTLY